MVSPSLWRGVNVNSKDPTPRFPFLTVPGYLVFPMGEKELQTLVRIRKDRGGIREEYFGECQFVRLTGRYGWEN